MDTAGYKHDSDVSLTLTPQKWRRRQLRRVHLAPYTKPNSSSSSSSNRPSLSVPPQTEERQQRMLQVRRLGKAR